jgi:hypothetical protein
MRLIPERGSLPRLLVFPFGLLTVVGLLAALRDPARVREAARCPLLDVTGIPCPTCGGTGTVIALVHGHWREAFATNPFLAAAVILFGAWLIWALAATVWPALRRDLELSTGEKKAARIAAGAALVAAWIWQVVRLG